MARTIDQLSREHGVVFVTITGNILPADVQDLLVHTQYPDYLGSPAAKLLDPGHAALAVTVGSIAHSSRVIVAPGIPIAQENQPSPFTRTGPGFAKSVKPDFVERGGNLVRDPQLGVRHNVGTNVVMASNRLTPPLQHSHGTSFAAPRVANHLVVIAQGLRPVIPRPTAPLLRAFLALSAELPSNSPLVTADELLNTVGYGLPDGSRATNCAGHSVILYFEGSLKADQVALFRIPVPVEIKESGHAKKRIVVAVATAPPVQTWGVAEYLGANFKFRLFRGDKSINDIAGMMQREEEEQNLPANIKVEDLPSALGIRRRSVGTLQRDVFGMVRS